ncbi:MAG: PKD domain-containing protein, partial [Bacteroidota bacterium]
MKQPFNLLFYFLVLSIFLFQTSTINAQQFRYSGFNAQFSNSEEKYVQGELTELPEYRKQFSSAYKKKDGCVVFEYSELPLNYFKNGHLNPVETKPVLLSGWLLAMNQPSPVKVDPKGAVYINAESKNEIKIGENVVVNELKTKNGVLYHSGENAEIINICSDVNKTFHFSYAGVKYNYELLKRPAKILGDFIIEEEISLPEGAKIVEDSEHGKKSSTGWQGILNIVDKNNIEIARFRPAICFDQKRNSVVASYKHLKKNGKNFLQIIVPISWISNASTSYPVIIDPLVTGPTTTYTTGLISSCLAPANNSDSIQITVPAQVTVTGLMVSGSYYANPFTTAVMSDGSMWFSTACDTSQIFTITGSTGSTAGTAYLTNYDLRFPLMCCIAQSCSTQTFYLKMHLQRTQPGTGCNNTYIYHDPLGGYPFKAYIEGHTVENTGLGWNINPNNLCSNVCNLNGTVWVRYGVPPYTVTHPWMTGSLTWQTPSGCSFGTSSKVLPLVVPNCPAYCDTVSQIAVPSPTVTDACGNVVSSFPAKILQIKKAPVVTATPNPINICSGDSFVISMNSCVPGSTITWNGNGNNGTGLVMIDSISNNSSNPTQTQYIFNVTANGCTGIGDTVTVNTFPFPNADFNTAPTIMITNEEIFFTNASTIFGDSINIWNWNFGNNSASNLQNPIYTYSSPGTYTVCLTTISELGCIDSVCKVIEVIPAEIVAPNIVTPNGDSINDFLS